MLDLDVARPETGERSGAVGGPTATSTPSADPTLEDAAGKIAFLRAIE